MAAQYTTLRLGSEDTKGNLISNWSDRTLPADEIWGGWTFGNNGSLNDGVLSDVNDPRRPGAPWEVDIALANESGKDLYVCLPAKVSLQCLDNLANLFAYGSNGVTPYTSPQANPAWAPLNSNLKVYLEISDEIWNSSYPDAGTQDVGWCNQLAQRAIYDYETGNMSDALYPGGGPAATTTGRSSRRCTSTATPRRASWPFGRDLQPDARCRRVGLAALLLECTRPQLDVHRV